MENTALKPNRDLTFDIAKALLIILVILGHSTKFNNLYQVIIYWFHMPAFFIISGIFFKDKGEDFLHLTLKVLKTYYLPLWGFYFLEAIIFNRVNLHDIKLNLYGGVMSTGSVYWFPVVLMFTFFIYTYLTRYFSKTTISIISIITYILAHLESIYLRPETFNKPVPLALDIVLLSLFYFHFASLLKNEIKKISNNKNILLSVLIVISSIILLALQLKRGTSSYIYTLNMKSGNYTHYILDIVIPTLFTLSTLIISNLISKIKFIKNIFAFIGKHTMPLMYVHIPILNYFRL